MFMERVCIQHRGGSRIAATSKMELFITKCSILDVAAVIDPPLQQVFPFTPMNFSASPESLMDLLEELKTFMHSNNYSP